MPRRHRSASRRQSSSRLQRIAIPIAIPVVLAAVVGGIVAVTDHSGANVSDAANANCFAPAAYVAPAKPANAANHHHHQGSGGTASPTAASSGTATPTTAASGTATPTTGATGTTATGTATPTTGATGTTAATPTSTATPCPSTTASATASATATATTAAANVNCDIVVPADPLSAQGLATPWQLTGQNGMTPQQSGCNMANAQALGAFVQATIIDPATGKLSVYNPLVITQGTTPAVTPTAPTLPANAVVTIDVGFNGTDLTQVGATANALQQGNCVNGSGGTDFGQVSFCNGPNFFAAVKQAEGAGMLTPPVAGTSTKIVASPGNGQNCPTTRNFDMIDQDQSDNVTATYLLNPQTGQTAQNTTANAANMTGSAVLANGSDNLLVDQFLDPTLGCTPFSAPDLGNNNTPSTSQALNEILSAATAPTPTALVPENDPMTLDGNGNFNVTKDNLYRSEVGQDPVSAANDAADSPAMYCQNMVNIETAFLAANQTLLATGMTPVPGTGNNLLNFMANRENMSFTNLNCQNFGLTNPVNVTLDGNGAAVAATFNTTPQTATNTAGTATPTATPTAGATTPAAGATPGQGQGANGARCRTARRHHQCMNASGM